MKTAMKNGKNTQAITSSEKKKIDFAAKKIVKHYGKTLKLLANE